MINENKARLIVNINDLRRRNEARAAKSETTQCKHNTHTFL